MAELIGMTSTSGGVFLLRKIVSRWRGAMFSTAGWAKADVNIDP